MEIATKRAYDPVGADDGYRVLVDRLWPRGVKKEDLALDEWCKEVAPSTALRRWFGHDPARFEAFSERYREELAAGDAPARLLERAQGHRRLTLVYGAKDPVHHHAAVLKAVLEGQPVLEGQG